MDRLWKKTLWMVLALCAGVSGARAGDVTARRMTWAHYVPWLTPDNVSQDPDRWVNAPVHERGDDPFRDEIRRATAAGIDGFFMDIVCYEQSMAYWDLRPFLKAAEGTDFQFGICLDRKVAVETAVRQLVQMLGTYGDHPNYPKADGRYVVNAYTFLGRTPEEWRAVLDGCRDAGYPIYLVANTETFFEPYDDARLEPYADIVDTIYYFSLTGLGGISSEDENRRAAAFCRRHGKRYMPCLHPGYFGAWMRGRNDCYQPFRGIDRLFDHWQSAVTFAGESPWLHVTTWNDHDETTLQPRRLTPADGLLLSAYANAYHGRPPAAAPEVVFAYHREELPGTLIRIEAQRLASAATGPVEVEGVLRGPNGNVVAKLGAKRLSGDWDRCEWQIDSASLAGLPHLVPNVSVKWAGAVRRGTLQPILFRTPWLEHPETVKTALRFQRDNVRADWSLSQTGNVLTAEVSFKSPVIVRRAILYRNDRPLGQFTREAQAAPRLAVCYSSQNFTRLSVKDGRLLSVVKYGETNGAPNFAWDEQKADSKLTPGWMRFSALIEAPPDAVVTLSGNNWKKTVSATPPELAQRRMLSDAPVTLRLSPDCTLRDRPPLDCRGGRFSLSLYVREPYPADAYWIAFECEDGTVSETPIRQTYAGPPGKSPILATAVTLETHSDACGRPDRQEWLAPPNAPRDSVQEVVLAAGTRRHAHWSFEKSGIDSAGDRPIDGIPADMYAEGHDGCGLVFDGKRSIALPRQLWPTGAWRISAWLKPEAPDGERRIIFGKKGWHDGVSLALDGDGRLVATFSFGDGGAGEKRFQANAERPLEPGKWSLVELVCDARVLRIRVDGADLASVDIPPVRRYGNLTAFLGAPDASAPSYCGLLDELDIGCM
jgi:hypothetical protein